MLKRKRLLAPLLCAISIGFGCGSDASSSPMNAGEAGASSALPDAGGSPAGSGGSAPSTGAGGDADGGAVSDPAAGSGGRPASAGRGGTAAVSGRGGTAAVSGRGGSAGGGGAGASGAGGSAGRAAAGSGGAPGDGGTLNQTIVVAAGQTFDGQGKRYTAGPALGDGGQGEDQKPMFRLEDGATLVNVVLGGPAADGVHCHGDVTLRNIVWEDIGEDALTIKEPGTVTLDGGSATDGDDKVFQINAESTFRVSNFEASNAGKFIRQNGGSTFKVAVVIDRCDISNMDESIFRTDSDSSTVEMTNTRYSNIGDVLFMGVAPANITTSNNTEY